MIYGLSEERQKHVIKLFLNFTLIIVQVKIIILSYCYLRLHNNGRLLDVYWRLHGRDDQYFLPYDLEISNQELSYIVRKAEQWRGEEGARRKVAVYDYIWEEDEVIWVIHE